MHRRVKNQRLAAAGYLWAFAALTASPGARAHYDRRRAAGDRHTAAQRNLFNRHDRHACTTASQPPPNTTSTPPSPQPAPTRRQPPLDKLSAWDVSPAPPPPSPAHHA